ncbi:MAG: amidohydrolase [Solirubrobacteraceae bacterium]
MTTLAYPKIDLHQHVWTEPLLDALASRDRLPLVRRAGDPTVLHCAGERPYAIDLEASSATRRTALLDDDGADLAVVALSSPIGIEALPRDEAVELIARHLDGVLELGDRFAAWGPVATRAPDPADVDRVLARGCVGVSVPAPAITGAAALDALRPLLERVQQVDAPLFVHPGSADGDEAPAGEPDWWRAMTGYIGQMQAAWLTFATRGRAQLPGLRVVFSMLAGGAPLQRERLAARHGPRIDPRDPLSFYDASSYGRAMVDAVAAVVGDGQLVYGSDRPVVEPVTSGREPELMRSAGRLLGLGGRPLGLGGRRGQAV